MFNMQGFVSVCSLIVGTMLILTGLAGIGMYIYSVISVLDQSDRSAIFWYFILVIIEIILLICQP